MDLKASRMALFRLTAARHRLEARKARTDMREWQVKRRERTRQLIELGGLVVKAGLVELADDDRATLYGAFLAAGRGTRAGAGALETQGQAGVRNRKQLIAALVENLSWNDTKLAASPC